LGSREERHLDYRLGFLEIRRLTRKKLSTEGYYLRGKFREVVFHIVLRPYRNKKLRFSSGVVFSYFNKFYSSSLR
jgi:hypothetical protein